MSSEVNQQNILDQFDELKTKLQFIKNQLKDSKEKLSDPKLFIELNKSKNFFTEHIINKLEKEIRNEKLIKENNDFIQIIENYIKDIESMKSKISEQIKNKQYDSELLKSISSSLSTAISTISPLCTENPKPANSILKTGKTLLYGGSAALLGGLATLILCPIVSPFLFMGGAVGCATGAPLTIVGNTIESIKSKFKSFLNIFK